MGRMYEVSDNRSAHRIKQLSVFLPNRLGQLLMVHRALESHDVKLRAISIIEAVDHAVVRIVPDKPTLAAATLVEDGYSVVEADLLGVVLPTGVGIGRVLKALLLRELNVHYVYSLLTSTRRGGVLALHVEDLDVAGDILTEQGFQLVDQDDL